MTSGRETEIQASVTLLAVCDQRPLDDVVADMMDELAWAREFDTARLLKEAALERAEEAVLRRVEEDSGSGGEGERDAVELRKLLRGEPLVGDASGGGKSRGC